MLDAKLTFSKLAKIGNSTLEALKTRHLAPNNTKSLRSFSAKEARELISCKKSSLNTAEESGKLKAPPLIVPEGKKKPVKQYTLELINDARSYFGTLTRKPNNKPAAKIAIINFKGGPGKTTNAVNLAQAYALKGYRILLIDIDNQGSATHCFGYIPDFDISVTQRPAFRTIK